MYDLILDFAFHPSLGFCLLFGAVNFGFFDIVIRVLGLVFEFFQRLWSAESFPMTCKVFV